jgi:hypothetical protein
MVAACGGSSLKGFHNVTVSQGKASSGSNTFHAAGMAITFTYPASLRARPLEQLLHTGGNTKNSSIAALGIDQLNFLAVSRTPVPGLVTKQDIGRLLGDFDALMTRLAQQPLHGMVVDLDGAPGIGYPRIPVPGLAGATSRVTYLFVGKGRYELQCQATKAHLAAIESACTEALATLKVSP